MINLVLIALLLCLYDRGHESFEKMFFVRTIFVQFLFMNSESDAKLTLHTKKQDKNN